MIWFVLVLVIAAFGGGMYVEDRFRIVPRVRDLIKRFRS